MTLTRSAGLRMSTAALIVLAHAGAQAALVVAAPRLPLDAAAIALAIVSGLTMLAAAGALWVLVLRAMSRPALVTLAIAGLAAAAFAVAAPVVIPLVVAVASPLIAATTPTAAWSVARRHPGRTAIWLIVTAVAVVLGTVVAMLLGLLEPGALGVAVAWIVIGGGAAVLIVIWARWARTVSAPDPTQP